MKTQTINRIRPGERFAFITKENKFYTGIEGDYSFENAKVYSTYKRHLGNTDRERYINNLRNTFKIGQEFSPVQVQSSYSVTIQTN